MQGSDQEIKKITEEKLAKVVESYGYEDLSEVDNKIISGIKFLM